MTVTGHVVALIALVLWSGPVIIVATLLLAVALSLFLFLRRPWPVRLRLLRDGTWKMRCSDGRIVKGSLHRGRIAGNLISLTLTGPPRQTVVLLPDAFRDGDHGRLRAWLRHRRGAASC